MNYYRVTRAHNSRAIGTIVESDSPQDAYLSAIGFLRYMGSDVPMGRGHAVDQAVMDEVPASVANPRRKRRAHGVEVVPGPGGSADVRDPGGDNLGGEDGSGS